jgi:hypothetical protein
MLYDLASYPTHVAEDGNTASYYNSPFMFDGGQALLLQATNIGHIFITCKFLENNINIMPV